MALTLTPQSVAFVEVSREALYPDQRFSAGDQADGGHPADGLALGRIQEPLDHLVYRCTSGRTTLTSWLGEVQMTMLTTIGARSGQPRKHVVLAMPDGERLVVIASNYGRHQHPAWYHNLRADPRASIEIGGVARDVIAHELRGAERECYYQRGVEVYPGFTLYRRRARREIPVLALESVR